MQHALRIRVTNTCPLSSVRAWLFKSAVDVLCDILCVGMRQWYLFRSREGKDSSTSHRAGKQFYRAQESQVSGVYEETVKKYGKEIFI